MTPLLCTCICGGRANGNDWECEVSNHGRMRGGAELEHLQSGMSYAAYLLVKFM
jgi:hypothetical protein